MLTKVGIESIENEKISDLERHLSYAAQLTMCLILNEWARGMAVYSPENVQDGMARSLTLKIIDKTSYSFI